MLSSDLIAIASADVLHPGTGEVLIHHGTMYPFRTMGQLVANLHETYGIDHVQWEICAPGLAALEIQKRVFVNWEMENSR